MSPVKPKPKVNPASRLNRPTGKSARSTVVDGDNGPSPQTSISLGFQQVLLNIFKNAFADRLETDVYPLLQEIKGHLFNRDFATAFGKQDYLETYAARWSSSRALGYVDVLWGLKEYLSLDKDLAADTTDGGMATEKHIKIVCLGGGAGAEIIAFAGLKKLLIGASDDSSEDMGVFEVVAIDISDWSDVVHRLSHHVTALPPLSRYASAAVQAANAALLRSDEFIVSFQQHDILALDTATWRPIVMNARLITLMFTLNELYTISLPRTQSFLLHLTNLAASGTLLLVVDSPGSYSTVTLNGAEKKYPMQWLLDHTLLKQTAGKGDDAKWIKVHEDQSRWFRLNPKLSYPIELENMRMQMHLYRRV